MLAVFDNFEMNPTFIFIDGSYYCFYRYYALHNWWKNAYPEEKLVDPLINQTFVDKYNERKQKLDEISIKIKGSLKDTTKQKEELKNMKSQLRKEHLNFLYNIENICNSFKNLKDTI